MIKVIPSSEGGEMFSIDEVQQYLDAVNITSYDLKGLDTYPVSYTHLTLPTN